jgi:hypothetical protein
MNNHERLTITKWYNLNDLATQISRWALFNNIHITYIFDKNDIQMINSTLLKTKCFNDECDEETIEIFLGGFVKLNNICSDEGNMKLEFSNGIEDYYYFWVENESLFLEKEKVYKF